MFSQERKKWQDARDDQCRAYARNYKRGDNKSARPAELVEDGTRSGLASHRRARDVVLHRVLSIQSPTYIFANLSLMLLYPLSSPQAKSPPSRPCGRFAWTLTVRSTRT